MLRFSLLVLLACLWSCAQPPVVPMNLTESALIPQPQSVTPFGKSYRFDAVTPIYLTTPSGKLDTLGRYLQQQLQALGLQSDIRAGEMEQAGIQLSLNGPDSLGAEGYWLEITEKGIRLQAKEAAGLFYGMQSLRQLLPFEPADTIRIATGRIVDAPVYPHRGAMLDVARHFFKPADVKVLIDYLAMLKMNKLHLHLADDQGWRIEIKSWPKLTKIGGSTQVGGGKGGFYTQQEYADMVAYAAERFITIIPEIDMPGHTNAALASYPELNCNGKASTLYTGTDVGFSTLCTDKEVTYQFVDDVIRELAALTPGAYIHIGGDESHVTPLEDYIPFINRVQQILRKHNKKMLGWDEIAHADIDTTTVVQWWAAPENARKAIEKGAKVLASPAKKAYLDMQYDSTTQLGLHWAAYVEVDSAYCWDPASLQAGIKKEHLIGIEAPLWTETITNLDELEYMVFPRIMGHAEIGWTAPALRKWEDYRERLATMAPRLKAMGIDFYASAQIDWK